MAEKIRLDKYLSDMLGVTRKEVKNDIRKGSITVNGVAVRSGDFKVEINRDEVRFEGRPIVYTKYYYYMFHKPAGVITSTEKGKTKTVMDVLLEGNLNCPFFKDLSPVGRLDKDTVGLLLFTNDGELIHKLLSPKSHVPKKYFVILDGILSEEAIPLFQKGLDLGDFVTKPAELIILENRNEALVTITEGKFHQVKRMFEKIGQNVIFLKRLEMGGLMLDESLGEGEYRELREEEIEILKNFNQRNRERSIE